MPLRKILVAGLLGAALSSPAFAQYETQQLYPFKGLYLSSGASVIDPAFATEALNVWYLREGGIQTRPGFAAINSSSLGAAQPWLLSRIYYGTGTPSFVVGIGDHIWRMGNAGAFTDPDSILGYRTGTVDWLTGSDTVKGRNTNWVGSVQSSDTIKSGANTWRIVRVIDDTTLQIHTTAASTATNQPYHILYSFTASSFSTAVQVGTNFITGNENHAAIVIRQDLNPLLLGAILQGTVNTLSGSSGTTWQITDNNGTFPANNGFAGYWVYVYGTRTSQKHIGQFCNILSNTSTTLTVDNDMGATQDVFVVGAQTGVKYWIFPMIFTVVDTGTVRRTSKTGPDVCEVIDLKSNVENIHLYRNCALEFSSGKLVSQQFTIDFLDSITGPPDSVKIRVRSETKNIGDFVNVGDKYIIWQRGVSSQQFVWHANQLVAAKQKYFPNQVRFSKPGTIHDFPPNNYFVVGDRSGTEIMRIESFNADLAIWQSSDTWKKSGSDLLGGQLIHALVNIGCSAPRSLAISGSEAYWLTIQSGMPKAVAWGGGGLKFNVVGDPSVYAGGDLQDISRSILPLMKGLNLANISKAAGGFWEDHYLLSVPESSSTVSSNTYCYHIPSGRWSRANFAGSIFYNATSVPDSGQLYFGNRHIGKINLFGGVETDTGSNISLAYATGDFTFNSSNAAKQLGSVELDYEKANTDSIALQVYKNLPATLINGYSLASGLSGYRTLRRGFSGVVGKSLRFRLSYKAAQGIKFHAFRFTYLPIGVL